MINMSPIPSINASSYMNICS